MNPEGNYLFEVDGIYFKGELVLRTIPLQVLVFATALLPLITIFLYKNRPLQIRLTGLNIILLLGIYGMIAYYYFFGVNLDLEPVAEFNYTLACPLLGALFSFLAMCAIGKDEALVRSLDRIR